MRQHPVLINRSGLVPLPLLRGALTLVVIVAQVVVVSALLVAADVLLLHLVVDVVTTLPARMIVGSVTMIGAIAIALGARTTVTAR